MLVVGACYKGPSLPHHLLTGFHSPISSNMNVVRCSIVTVGILTKRKKTPDSEVFSSVPSVLDHNLSFKLYVKMLFNTLS